MVLGDMQFLHDILIDAVAGVESYIDDDSVVAMGVVDFVRIFDADTMEDVWAVLDEVFALGDEDMEYALDGLFNLASMWDEAKRKIVSNISYIGEDKVVEGRLKEDIRDFLLRIFDELHEVLGYLEGVDVGKTKVL